MLTLNTILNSFWPNQQNSFRPLILRPPALAATLVVILLLQIGGHFNLPGRDTLGATQQVSVAELLTLTNQERERAGVAPLELDPRLTAAATAKAQDMLQQNYWEHSSPEGVEAWDFISAQGYSYSFAGENLAKDFQTNPGVVAGWMRSQTHRDNLLDPRYQDIGLAAMDGSLDSENTTLVVALYAAPQTLNISFPQAGGTTEPATATTYTLIHPLNIFKTMTPASLLGVTLLAGMGSLYLAQYMGVRRERPAWVKKSPPRSLFWAFLLFSVAAVLIQASFGIVG